MIAQSDACHLAGERTWLSYMGRYDLFFDELFLLIDLKSNLIRIGNPIVLLLDKTILLAIFFWPLLDNGYCACMPKICLFLLIEV